MADQLQELMNGTTGRFWTEIDDLLDPNKAVNGHVELKDDDLLHIETLSRHESMYRPYEASAAKKIPKTIYAATKTAGAIFYDPAGYRINSVIGGTRASSGDYRVRSVLCGIDLTNVASEKFTRMLVTFPRVMHWAGIGGVTTEVEKDNFGRSKSLQAAVRAASKQTAPKRRGMTLSFSSHWSMDGPDDVRELKNPLAVITESDKPKEWWDHLEPILAVQDLINMAYEGFVVADVGTADIEIKEQDDPHIQSPQLWISRIMRVPPGSKAPQSMNKIPVFNLLQIGGIRGVDGWVQLARKYGRATGPISKVYRFGTGLAVETRCMEIAAAVDYWSTIHRRAGVAWAQKSHGTLTEVLAKFAGPAFAQFVGNIELWSKIFRDTYNRIKHEPVFSYDPGDVYTVTRSAEILLQSALLNRIARNKKMTGIVCESNRNYKVGIEVRKIVDRGQL